jgi:heterodisulfide reductase subunit A-like polyferredoxin
VICGFWCLSCLAQANHSRLQQPFGSHVEEVGIVKDVVVVGGGASGTYAATRLMEKGFSVALVEKLDRLGGHSQTSTDLSPKKL